MRPPRQQWPTWRVLSWMCSSANVAKQPISRELYFTDLYGILSQGIRSTILA